MKAMAPHLREAIALWMKRGRRGPRPGIYLLTFTAPHSGDLGVDRRVMERGWRAVSKRASYGGYSYYGRWSERKWWGHHVLVWEATKGTDGESGHLHAHVAAISSWVPYDELRGAWNDTIARETDGVVRELHCEFVSPAMQQARAAERAKKATTAEKFSSVATAAFYLAKYVTKGVDPAELTGRKAGELLAASKGRRKVLPSRGFWRPYDKARCCTTCAQMFRLVDAPIGLQEHAPAAVLASMMERTRWRPPRGSPQQPLPVAGLDVRVYQ